MYSCARGGNRPVGVAPPSLGLAGDVGELKWQTAAFALAVWGAQAGRVFRLWWKEAVGVKGMRV